MLKIGITNRSFSSKNYSYLQVNKKYINAILKLHALPVIIINAEEMILEEYVKQIDGLIISGGEDIHPDFYNEKITYAFANTKEDDQNDLNLIKLCLKHNKPILGICRGLQIINVYFKGSLYQDLLKENVTDINHNQKKMPKNYTYYVNFEKSGPFYDIYGERYKVNSFHHQAIKKLGQGLEINGISDDGIIEAVSYKDKILAVQWHPEELIEDKKHLAIFKTFKNLMLNK